MLQRMAADQTRSVKHGCIKRLEDLGEGVPAQDAQEDAMVGVPSRV